MNGIAGVSRDIVFEVRWRLQGMWRGTCDPGPGILVFGMIASFAVLSLFAGRAAMARNDARAGLLGIVDERVLADRIMELGYRPTGVDDAGAVLAVTTHGLHYLCETGEGDPLPLARCVRLLGGKGDE
mgnify:CR=1 FL=1